MGSGAASMPILWRLGAFRAPRPPPPGSIPQYSPPRPGAAGGVSRPRRSRLRPGLPASSPRDPPPRDIGMHVCLLRAGGVSLRRCPPAVGGPWSRLPARWRARAPPPPFLLVVSGVAAGGRLRWRASLAPPRAVSSLDRGRALAPPRSARPLARR